MMYDKGSRHPITTCAPLLCEKWNLLNFESLRKRNRRSMRGYKGRKFDRSSSDEPRSGSQAYDKHFQVQPQPRRPPDVCTRGRINRRPRPAEEPAVSSDGSTIFALSESLMYFEVRSDTSINSRHLQNMGETQRIVTFRHAREFLAKCSTRAQPDHYYVTKSDCP